MISRPRIQHFAIGTGRATVVFLLGTTTAVAQVSTLPSAGHLDESLFREGLRQRGLTDWLEQYLADTPPLEDVDARLRQREKLLDEAAKPALTDDQRRTLVTEASAILSSLISEHPGHSARLRWRFELARDTLERLEPQVFDALLLYDLPGRDRARVNELSTRAVEILETLRQQIADAWKSFEALDEAAIEQAVASGSLRVLESLDARSASLFAWAQLHHELSADLPEADRQRRLSVLLTEVAQRYGWTEPGRPAAQRCGALVIATIAARSCGELDQANRCARGIVATFKDIKAPQDRKRLRRAVLLAVLEQIRVMRDRGKFEDALKAVEQARQWAERTRPGDVQTAVAVALAHRSVLAREKRSEPLEPGSSEPGRPRPGQRPPQPLLQPPRALVPLQQLAERSPEHRDALYAATAGALASEPISTRRSPFELQLLLGAAVMDAIVSRERPEPDIQRRLKKAIDGAQDAIDALPADVSSAIHGELLFLLGRAHYLAGMHLEAVGVLADLVERFGQHDRASGAAEQAVAIAQEFLRRPDQKDPRTARDSFVRAVRLLRKQSPGSPAARKLQYFVALALEANGHLEEAAEEYAAVPGGDPYVLKARLGRARCLRNALNRAVADRTLSGPGIRELAERALNAAREAATAAEPHAHASAQDESHLLAGEIILLLSNLLNHPSISRPAEVLTVLEGFEQRFADQPALVGAALRERVLALRELKRLREARLVVGQFLKADPQAAGPVMARLLEAMRNEIDNAAARGDTEAAQRIAREAAQLAGTLLDWSEQRPDRVGATDRLAIRVWQAGSLRDAGRTDEALGIYEECSGADPGILPATSALRTEIRLGRAECLLELDRARDALLIFTDVWQGSPEQSPDWWRAFVGCLKCHTRLAGDPTEILQSIRQQRHLDPDLGGPRWRRELEVLEKVNMAGMAGTASGS